jgi:Predicted hydrolases or acyltransferases (alpha/beta hydrolase superfamily)
LPLILTHGWPSSFADYLDMIGPLTDPVAYGGKAEDAFTVVIPSMPGFGFSGQTHERGWTMARIAQTWDTLMKRLGYDRYGAHGTDGGAQIGRELGLLNPDGLIGTHVLQLFSFPSGDPSEFENLSEKDQAGLAFLGPSRSGGFSAAMSSGRSPCRSV